LAKDRPEGVYITKQASDLETWRTSEAVDFGWWCSLRVGDSFLSERRSANGVDVSDTLRKNVDPRVHLFVTDA